MTTSKTQTKIWTVNEGKLRSHSDYIAAETPLQIRLVTSDLIHNLAITMRTPGHDFDLVIGFLFSEGIIKQKTDILQMSHGIKSEVERENRYNIVNVKLTDEKLPDLNTLNRHFYTNSACGVCGKTSIESLKMLGVNPIESNLLINVEIIYNLP
jgi:FdhD protein